MSYRPTEDKALGNLTYRHAEVECWRCHEVTAVYTWDEHVPWPTREPPSTGRPSTVRFLRSSVVPDGYWGNVCQHCGAVQGDWFLYMEPDGPFCGCTDGGA